MRWLPLALLLAACVGRVQHRPAERATDALQGSQWCITVTLYGDSLVACTSDRSVCTKYQTQVRNRGALFGVQAVSECEPVRMEGR